MVGQLSIAVAISCSTYVFPSGTPYGLCNETLGRPNHIFQQTKKQLVSRAIHPQPGGHGILAPCVVNGLLSIFALEFEQFGYLGF